MSPSVEPFDEAKYKALMDGLECSEQMFSLLEGGLRIDSEPYQKQYVLLDIYAKNHQWTTFSSEADVVSKGIFNISASCYSAEGVPFVRISNIDGMIISENGIVFIPESENSKYSRTHLKRGDIILSKTGGPAAAYLNMPECNLSQDTVAIKLKSNAIILPEYTVAYLNCKYGLAQMKKRFTGNIQMHLNLEDCKNKVIIPVMSETMQKGIKAIFQRALSCKDNAQKSFKECEKLLVDAIGFSEKDIRGTNKTIKNYKASYKVSGRLDAEFYSEKYDRLYALLHNCRKVKSIQSIATYNVRGRQPKYCSWGTINVINSKHILENSLDYGNFEKADALAWERNPSAQIRNEDILTYTTGANIGRTAIFLSQEKAIASNHVNILRTVERFPVYIAVVLNSFIGKVQTERFCGGSAQQELYPAQIDEFLIPFVDVCVQERISNLYKAAVAYNEKSRTLFSIAAHSIEVAIEQGEQMALEWLKSEVN